MSKPNVLRPQGLSLGGSGVSMGGVRILRARRNIFVGPLSIVFVPAPRTQGRPWIPQLLDFLGAIYRGYNIISFIIISGPTSPVQGPWRFEATISQD